MQVAQKLIEQLKNGTLPWVKPWTDHSQSILPYNEQTGNRYKGINILNLLLTGRADPRWMTFKQAEASGFRVNQGEKGTMIQFVKTHQSSKLRDEKGNLRFDDLGKPVVISTPLPRAIVTNAWVFNAEQISGLEKLENLSPKTIDWNPVERAEELILTSKAEVSHKYIDRAYYDMRYDEITMPNRSQFSSAQKYYATLLHELGHWTGHPDRLDRATLLDNGMEAYAREELRAEISSLLLADELQIAPDLSQHAAYIESWVSILEDSPFEIFAAAADAERIFSFLVGLEQKREARLAEEMLQGNHSTVNAAEPLRLSTGDEISYKDHIYRIQGHLKQGRLKVEQIPTGINFTLNKSDKLHDSLLQAKRNSLTGQIENPAQIDQDQRADKSSKLKR